jgi:hypothetical protein
LYGAVLKISYVIMTVPNSCLSNQSKKGACYTATWVGSCCMYGSIVTEQTKLGLEKPVYKIS